MVNDSKHSILIVADAFGKPAYSPRLRSLCDYLVSAGWQVEVYTEQFVELNFEHSYPIYECKIYKNHTWDWALKAFFSLITDWKNRYFSRWLIRKTEGKQYDLVFCTTFSTFPLRAAADAAHRKGLPFHVDLRDIDEQAPNSQYQSHRQWWARPFRRLYRNINIRRRNHYIKEADTLTTVSPWHVSFLQQWNSNTHLIYNGFEKNLFYPEDCRSESFKIVYTGRIYESVLQEPEYFLQALQPLASTDVKMVWYTHQKGQNLIRKLSTELNISHVMEYHDYVATQEIPAILQDSSIVLVLAHHPSQQGPHGIMTTKFFEALGVEKPVLCVPSDEECLARVIQETNAGIASSDKEEIQQFILDKYKEWKEKGFTRQAVIQEKKELFSRQRQARQFEELFLKAIE